MLVEDRVTLRRYIDRALIPAMLLLTAAESSAAGGWYLLVPRVDKIGGRSA